MPSTRDINISSIKDIHDNQSDILTALNLASLSANAASGGWTLSGAFTVGADDTGYDVTFYGATSGKSLLWDESADSLIVGDDTYLKFGDDGDAIFEYDEDGNNVLLYSGANMRISDNVQLQFGNGGDVTMQYDETTDDMFEINAANGIYFTALSAAKPANALIMGAGTSGTPATTSTADKVFMEWRTQSTATSGDSRCLYMRHDINGAAGGGDCLRAFAKVTAAAATVRGAHISLDLDAAGSLSGFGAGVDAQLMLGAAAYDDDVTVNNLEIYGNAGATVTGRTSFLRPVIQGDSTAVADINANAFFIDFSNVVASASGLIDTDITALTGYGGLKVRCPDGVTRYIPIITGS